MAGTGVYPCYKNQFQAGATKETATSIADMETFGVSFDNNIEEWTPYDTEGWKRRLMTGKGITISVNGKRNIGDAGNDFVAGLKFKNEQEAEGYFGWTFPDGTIVSWDNAIYNIKNVAAGDATAVGPLEFDVLSNGKPTVTPAL